jgi:hypothetical protein
MAWPGLITFFCLHPFCLWIRAKTPYQTGKNIIITYTGNMGVLINNDKTVVWIDGLHEFYAAESINPPDSILEKVFSKTAPFNHLQWLLFTHYHRDHFSKKLSNRFLQLSSNHKVISAHRWLTPLQPKMLLMHGIKMLKSYMLMLPCCG